MNAESQTASIKLTAGMAVLAGNTLQLALPLVLMQIYDRVIPSGNQTTLAVLGLGLAGAIATEFLLRSMRADLLGHIAARTEIETYRRLHCSALRADLAILSREPIGVHMGRLRAVEHLGEANRNESATAALDLVFAIAFLAFLYMIAPPVAVAMACLILIGALLIRRSARMADRAAALREDIDGRRSAFLLEVIGAMETVKAIGAGSQLVRRYERLMAGGAELSRIFVGNSILSQGVVLSIGTIAPLCACVTGAVMLVNEQLTIGGLAASILLSSRAVQQSLRFASMIEGGRALPRRRARIDALMQPPNHESGRINPGPIDRLTLDRISITVADEPAPMLKEASLTVRRGETVLLRAPVGAGKTALLDIIAGHLAPSAGRILFNDLDATECDPRSVRRSLAYLQQEHSLLEGTLLQNMTRFQPERHAPEALDLAERLGLQSHLDALSLGCDMRVQRGVPTGLPSGVVSLVAIIASLVGRPDVILFDEANLSLDQANDIRLREHLRCLKPEVAMLMVTQRPSYFSICDRFVRIEATGLVEEPQAQARTRRDPSAWVAALAAGEPVGAR